MLTGNTHNDFMQAIIMAMPPHVVSMHKAVFTDVYANDETLTKMTMLGTMTGEDLPHSYTINNVVFEKTSNVQISPTNFRVGYTTGIIGYSFTVDVYKVAANIHQLSGRRLFYLKWYYSFRVRSMYLTELFKLYGYTLNSKGLTCMVNGKPHTSICTGFIEIMGGLGDVNTYGKDIFKSEFQLKELLRNGPIVNKTIQSVYGYNKLRLKGSPTGDTLFQTVQKYSARVMIEDVVHSLFYGDFYNPKQMSQHATRKCWLYFLASIIGDDYNAEDNDIDTVVYVASIAIFNKYVVGQQVTIDKLGSYLSACAKIHTATYKKMHETVTQLKAKDVVRKAAMNSAYGRHLDIGSGLLDGNFTTDGLFNSDKNK